MESDVVATVREVIRNRRSVRSGYTGEQVPIAILRDIVEAGVYAPTGGNTQGVRFQIHGPSLWRSRNPAIGASWPRRIAQRRFRT
jgi:hypothetical protein